MPRPVAVTVFGWLNIGFGALGVICTPIQMLNMQMGSTFGGAEFMDAFAYMETPAFKTYLMVSLVLGFIVVLIVAGVGLLNLRPWARLFSIGYAIYSYVAMVVGSAITYSVMLPAFEEMEAGDPFVRIGMMSGLGGACCGLVYPTVLLVFMFLPQVKQAFEPGVPPPLPEV